MDNQKLSPEGQQAAYAEVVRQRYNSFMPKFINVLCKRYSFLSHSEAMDIYTDVFIAIYDNLQKGRIAPDTNWEAYMLKIGINIVEKIYRAPKEGKIISLDFDSLFDETPDDTESRTDRILGQVSSIEDTDNPYEDPELIEALNLAMSHLPGKCAMIMRYFYYNNMSMDAIATLLGYNAAVTVRNRKAQCMKQLAKEVKEYAARLGYDL